jgi:DNA polymerase V
MIAMTLSSNPPKSRGGFRPGAGRKPKSGIPGEPSAVMRIPVGDKAAVIDLINIRRQLRTAPIPAGASRPAIDPPKVLIPLFSNRITAGFPSPADDYIEDRLDLNQLLVKNGPATYFLNVVGDSMVGAGIFEGDKLIVDRSLEPKHGNIVVAVVDGEHTVKRLFKRGSRIELRSENPHYPPIRLKEGQELLVFGVVTSSIHPVK